jgi:hypothetical protein
MFVPGKILAERNQIVSLLGNGGIGEVHHADGLKQAADKGLTLTAIGAPGRRTAIDLRDKIQWFITGNRR